MKAVFALFLACVVLVVINADFDDTYQNYEFIYHDDHNLILIQYADRCYFVRFPDSQESHLNDGNAYYDSFHHFHPSSLQQTELSLLQHVWNNRSGEVRGTSLDAMATQFGDVLANFHCRDKHVYQILMQPVYVQHPSGQQQQQPVSCPHRRSNGFMQFPGNCQQHVVCTNRWPWTADCTPTGSFMDNFCIPLDFLPQC